jgi:DNA mismatch repair protein MutS2
VVAKPRRDQVTVAVGAMKTTVGVDALASARGEPREAASSKTPRPPQRKAQPVEATPARTAQAARMPSNTVNLVGQRVEPALERLDAFIDELLRKGDGTGFALHGHGTGALKNAVREHLAQHPCVSEYGPASAEDGGDAFTIFWLR